MSVFFLQYFLLFGTKNFVCYLLYIVYDIIIWNARILYIKKNLSSILLDFVCIIIMIELWQLWFSPKKKKKDTVKPVLRGHLWDKEKVVFQDRWLFNRCDHIDRFWLFLKIELSRLPQLCRNILWSLIIEIDRFKQTNENHTITQQYKIECMLKQK